MKVSFEGIGQWAATFSCGDGVTVGHVVKISDNGEVEPCGAGEAFCGTTAVVARDGMACSVVLGGMVTVPYTGAAPALGWSGLTADGEGGIKADDSGREYLVVDVDSVGMMATFAL